MQGAVAERDGKALQADGHRAGAEEGGQMQRIYYIFCCCKCMENKVYLRKMDF